MPCSGNQTCGQSTFATHNFEELSSLIEKTSATLIRSSLENWHAKLTRARARDEERLKAYYGTISSEITSKIEFRHLMGEEKERISALKPP